MKELSKLTTGVKGLDEILNGGFPLYSINVIAGPSGSGKTILTSQILYHNATAEHKGLQFVTISEPSLKLLQYQQQFDYFDPNKINNSMMYLDIGEVISKEGMSQTLEFIFEAIDKYLPKVIVIDSFKAIYDLASSPLEARKFGYELAMKLAVWECTALLVGEYTDEEIVEESIFAIADGILKLYTQEQGMQDIRYLKVLKMRGSNSLCGKHPFTISREGITVYPRIKTPLIPPSYKIGETRISTGISGLDEMAGGGLPKGTSTLVAGGAGTGKTLLGLHFLNSGVSNNEPGVLVSFQETPCQLTAIAKGFGWDMEQMEKEGKIKILYNSPVELNIDIHATKIKEVIDQIGARRVVIDSLTDIEIATPDKVRYRDYIYSLVNYFKSQGISSLMTNEIPELFGSIRLSGQGISFISDNVILLRYEEIASGLKRAINILKIRGSNHDKEIREFEITSKGIHILKAFREYSSLLTGTPTLMTLPPPQNPLVAE